GGPTAGPLGTGFEILAAADTRAGRVVERPKIVEGREARSDRADEGVADQLLARALHLHAGSVLKFSVAPTTASGADVSKARQLSVKVVGIGVTRDNVVAVNALASAPTLLATPALLK